MVPHPDSTIDYLAIGHITQDLTPHGVLLGGTVTYSGLTASALGYKTGILSSVASDADLSALQDIDLEIIPAAVSSTFENIYGENGRQQYIRDKASDLALANLPQEWRNPEIVHLGPLTGEVDPDFMDAFPDSKICLTPQGWLREWGQDGLVRYRHWERRDEILKDAEIVILSIEDLQGDENLVQDFANACSLFVLTMGPLGSRVFWQGEVRDFRPPEIDSIDPTGAGDIFAAAYFVRYHQTGDAWEAARFANELAAVSLTRWGVEGVPRTHQIRFALEPGAA